MAPDPAHAPYLKAADGRRLSPEPIAFRDRCSAVGAPYAIARTVDEPERILASWGALRVAVNDMKIPLAIAV